MRDTGRGWATGSGGVPSCPPIGWHHVRVPYEYRAVTIPRDATREQTRDMLAIHAEYGDWELTRHAIYADGKRRVTVRRRLRAEPLPPMAT